MNRLDTLSNIQKLDKENILGSIEKLPDQVEQAWNDIKTNNVPQTCYLAQNVVVAGMGGSALGARIVDSLVPDRTRVPIEVFTQYHIPNYVSRKTLVIISSYSGNTEETISTFHEALKREAQVFVITTGGKLKRLAERHGVSTYIINPLHNPSKQPRMALGYSITATIGLLAKCGFVTISDDDVVELVSVMRQFSQEFAVNQDEGNNLAKITARRLYQRMPILVASEHLVGSAHAFSNQLNETAKTFSSIFDIPELNHHLLEGLKNPPRAKHLLHFFFFESELYSKRVQLRYPITQEVLKKNTISYSSYHLRSVKKLHQIFELLSFGSYIQFYLAILYGINPAPIPMVDFFKDRLANI